MRDWIEELKIAIIEENMDRLIALSDDIPKTDDIDLAVKASALMQEAIKLAQEKKSILNSEMEKLNKAKHYLS